MKKASFVREPEVADNEFELQGCRQQKRTYSASICVKRHCGCNAFASLSKRRFVTNIFIFSLATFISVVFRDNLTFFDPSKTDGGRHAARWE